MMQIRLLFVERVISPDGTSIGKVGQPQYGLVAKANDDWVVARWTQEQPLLFQGRQISPAEIGSALGADRR
jgi:hypothetical protein